MLNDDDGCSGGIDNEVDDSEYDEYDDDDQLHLQYNDNCWKHQYKTKTCKSVELGNLCLSLHSLVSTPSLY